MFLNHYKVWTIIDHIPNLVDILVARGIIEFCKKDGMFKWMISINLNFENSINSLKGFY